jgi:glycosyltransferase involved in cell wall biosynthesis
MSNIALNATMLNSQSGGIGVYIRNLVEHLYLLPPETSVKIFAGIQAQHLISSDLENVEIVPINCDSKSPVRRVVNEYFSFPKALSQNKIDLFHSPISYIPPGVNLPAVLTVHDLRYFHYPETYTKLRGKFLEKMVPRSVDKAKEIIAVSEYTKSDLVKMFGISPDKIHVFHEGINANAFNRHYDQNEWKTIQKKYALPERYILSVGHLEPRKNYGALFESLVILQQRYSLKVPLVIVGQETWYFNQLYKKAVDLGIEEQVLFTKFVRDKELAAFYQHADLFVTPSFFEGFGFTPLEAQAAGTPVIASNATSFPEVLADSALLVGPLDTDEMAISIKNVLLNKELQDDLKDRGRKNVKRFDWSECCKKTFQLYMNTLEEKWTTSR